MADEREDDDDDDEEEEEEEEGDGDNEDDEKEEERLLRCLLERFAGTSLCATLLSCMAEVIQAEDVDDEGLSDLLCECKETVIASHEVRKQVND